MKIDLHLHTIAINKVDEKTRKIDNKSFIKILEENDIGVAAITNHNIFSLEDFNGKKSENYLLLPGVEIDVLYKTERKQVNVIFPACKAKELDELTTKHLSETSYSSPIEFEKMIEFFDDEETLMFFDLKNGKTAWKLEEYNNLQTSIKSTTIADAPNSWTHIVFMSHGIGSLIGSDIKDWKKYKIKSKKLINVNVDIKESNYVQFIKMIKYDPTAIQTYIDKRIIIDTPRDLKVVSDDSESIIKNFTIYKGVNVIFGPRATGKSSILINVKDTHPSKVAFYSSSNKDEKYKKLFDNKTPSESSKKKLSEIRKHILEIKNFEAPKYKNFKNFLKTEIGKKGIIKFHTKEVKNLDEPSSATIIKSLLVKINDYITDLKELKGNSGFKKLMQLSIESKTILFTWWINQTKESRLSKLKITLNASVSKIVSQKKGIFSTPINIGLFEEWSSRNEYKNKVEHLKKMSFTDIGNIVDIEIPGKGKFYLKKSTQTINFGNHTTTKEYCNQVGAYKNFADLFININIPSKELENKISVAMKKFNVSDDGLSKTSISFVNNKEKMYMPSNGEQALILLTIELNKNKNIYILDEPGVFLGNEMISDNLLTKITDLKREGKTILLTTHLASVGLNSMPINFIYRRNPSDNVYETFIGNFLQKEFINTNNNTKIPFKATVMDNFEGGEKHFNFRKGIYEN